ncbi:hypothetical protein AOZ06_26600 [Kibdelosporangium phytohabitans]|uniref:Uncharacterized protein n=1 Tax=Kibdelosporangium phytohabitans TaxID=860235 RepID=A0A0N9I1U4_9PSEU|nr:hypothetical protein AOZ06_26600 [Kibdelosporangium phytohabitans]
MDSASLAVQIRRVACTRSANSAILVRALVPWLASSRRFRPAPAPKRNRPSDSRSRHATSLAVMIGSRCVTRHTPVPSWRVLVTAATADSATNGS